jgi:hypothetical protein
MSSALVDSGRNILIQELEPLLISLYQTENGKSPTLYEFKQYVISYASERLVDFLINSESSIFSSMSPKETLKTVNLYIKQLRVW